ncbi:MAG TPA: GGDEF domain-containing protein [Candidatus Limnocylindrales bacterium]|nr:GGDEF domain-containing protein [Candidatus Limnocylindrales bacterium]
MRARRRADGTPLNVGDLLVFTRDGSTLRLAGGRGRGAGWAGLVEAEVHEEPLARKALRAGSPLRVRDTDPGRIIGPYWSRHAALVPVGEEHLVVVGDAEPIRLSDGELRLQAAEAVAEIGGIPTSKLLADELEVVDAIRQLMAYRPDTLRETARHIADVSASALSCDYAAVLIRGPEGPVVQVSGTKGDDCDDPKLCMELERLAKRLNGEPLLEQDVRSRGRLGRGGGLVSRYAMEIGSGRTRGILLLGHAAEAPRGFTQLCQRVGRALTEAADVLLGHAAAREELSAERDRFAREARTDDLTGLANRIAWTEAVEAERLRRSRYRRPVVVMSVDVDGLKTVNDRFGHQAGDDLLRAAADILRSTLRETDMVARIGGDEFGLLLPETGPQVAEPLVARMDAACEAWRSAAYPELRLSLSIGWAAPEPFGDLNEAMRTADQRMYEAKRQG